MEKAFGTAALAAMIAAVAFFTKDGTACMVIAFIGMCAIWQFN